MTRIQENCNGCTKAEAIKRSVPKAITSCRKTARPMQLYLASTGGYNYPFMLLDAHSNHGWAAFLRNENGPTVAHPIHSWHAHGKPPSISYGEFVDV